MIYNVPDHDTLVRCVRCVFQPEGQGDASPGSGSVRTDSSELALTHSELSPSEFKKRLQIDLVLAHALRMRGAGDHSYARRGFQAARSDPPGGGTPFGGPGAKWGSHGASGARPGSSRDAHDRHRATNQHGMPRGREASSNASMVSGHGACEEYDEEDNMSLSVNTPHMAFSFTASGSGHSRHEGRSNGFRADFRFRQRGKTPKIQKIEPESARLDSISGESMPLNWLPEIEIGGE